MCDVLKQMKNLIFWDMVEGGHRFKVWTKGGHELKKVGNPWSIPTKIMIETKFKLISELDTNSIKVI